MAELTNYAILVALTVVSYDYLVTFSEEVELVWSRKFTFGTALFFLNRYSPFIDMPISATVYLASWSISATECRNLILGSTPFIVIGVAASEVILVLRTIAIWNRNKYVLIGLPCCHLIAIAIAAVFTALYLHGLKFMSDPGERCAIIHVGKFACADIVTILIIESVIVVLTAIRAVHHLRYSSSSWVHQLYQRGILYFLVLFVFVLLNTVFPLFAPVHLKLLFMNFQRGLHSILCNRMFFQILQQKELGQFGIPKSYEPPEFEATNSYFQFALDIDTFTTPEEMEERAVHTAKAADTIEYVPRKVLLA